MTLLLVSFLGTGLLITVLAIPLALGNVAPNPWYGVRVRATRRNPDVWYYVNQRSGRDQIIVGIVNVVAATALYLMPEVNETQYTYGCMGVLFVSLGIMVALAMSYTRRAVALFEKPESTR